jgi:hypothetical protein
VSRGPFHLRRDPLQHCLCELLQASDLANPPLFHEGEEPGLREHRAALPRIAERRADCCRRAPEKQWDQDKRRSPIDLNHLEEAAVQLGLLL